MRYSEMPRLGVPVWTAAAFVACALAAGLAARAADPAPPAVEKIVQRFAADNAGVVVYHQSVVYEQRAPGNNEHDEQDISVLQQDRKTVGLRVHRVVDKGRTLSADELAKLQADTDKRYAGEAPHVTTRFSLPFYPEAAADYAFTAPKACADCAGGMAVDFTSAVKDERHGHGTLTFDPATSRIEKAEFVPNVAPKPANAGKVSYTFGRHDDGGWGVARTEEHYSGRVMLISGTLDRTTTITRVKHYASLDEGRRALAAAAP